jgi:threonine efflux protein
VNDFIPAANLGLAWSAYLLMTASPGPSNLSIMGIAMTTGRRDALVFASGVISGSCFWGLLAALGLSTVLMRYAHAMDLLRFLGGLYLLWLAFKSARSAWRRAVPAAANTSNRTRRHLYLHGLGLHLTNPKAVLSWLSVVAVGLPPGAPPVDALVVVGSCLVLGVCVFGGYAIGFSSSNARRGYLAARRPIESLLALVFGFAGLRLMLARTA